MGLRPRSDGQRHGARRCAASGSGGSPRARRTGGLHDQLLPATSPASSIRTARRIRGPGRAHRSETSCRTGGRSRAGSWRSWPAAPGPTGGPFSSDVLHRRGRPWHGQSTVWRVQTDSDGRLIASPRALAAQRQPHPVGPFRLSVGDLRAPDGALISAHCLRFDPPEQAELPARSARGVVVTLSPGETLRPRDLPGRGPGRGSPGPAGSRLN